MRYKRTSQTSIFDQFVQHEIGRELEAMSKLLDTHPKLLDGVAADLGLDAGSGRRGMSAESVLRCAVLKQYRQLTYKELAFGLVDSASSQAFARLPVGPAPGQATLQANIAAISEATWEAINRQLMAAAYTAKVERGTMWRVDSTAIEAPVHEPSDSSLLLDGVNVMVRLLSQAEQWPETPALAWHNHSRRAKKRARAIRYTRGKDKKKALYQDLIRVTEATMGYLRDSMLALDATPVAALAFDAWRRDAQTLLPLVAQIIDQTQRRVFNKEKCPPRTKFSVFLNPIRTLSSRIAGTSPTVTSST